MERWISKPRVLLGLCAVLLIAALNRQDPMVYAMFLFLGVVSLLGFMLPWLSLRSTAVRLDAGAEVQIVEGAASGLTILIERKLPWPAFMVEVETEWEWASQRIVLSQTVPSIRAGRSSSLAHQILFPCRGDYELIAVRLSSGFPLGLVRAQHDLLRPQIHRLVLPEAQPVRWPLPWDIAEDPQGELTTRRMGQSFELGMLRRYQYGEPVGRVSWRASARIGELVIQHFQQSGSVRLRVVVQLPYGPSFGDALGSGEQAIRLAAGVCQAALENGAQLFLHLESRANPVREGSEVLRSLARAESSGREFFALLARVADNLALGEQVAVVVNCTCPQNELLLAASALANKGSKVVVYIALGRRNAPSELAIAKALQQKLQHVGLVSIMEEP